MQRNSAHASGALTTPEPSWGNSANAYYHPLTGYQGSTTIDHQQIGDEMYVYDESHEEIVDDIYEDGLQWAHGITTIPTPQRRNIQNIAMPDAIRKHLIDLDLDSLRQMNPDDERYKELPMRYHSAFPLDDVTIARGTYGSFGNPSSLFKVIDHSDSQVYALRRIDNARNISQSIIKNAMSLWSEIRHPSIVSFYGISLEKGALFFTYAYHPKALTLKQKFLDHKGPLLNESSLWRILVQLSAAVRHVHSKNLALRVISPAHVILTSGGRARINNVGVADVIEFESRKSLMEFQVDDLVKLGYLILSIGTRVSIGVKNVDQALQMLQQNYSKELFKVTALLVSGKTTALDVCRLLWDRTMNEYEIALDTTDGLQNHLREEYENGRLFRLVMKLGFVNERMEVNNSPEWSEMGDRYILKLFRDYVFHQISEDGTPMLDAGHVVSSLNKLDVGDPEEIILSSRDSKDLIIVSYKDVRSCLEKAVAELSQLGEKNTSSSSFSANNSIAGSGNAEYSRSASHGSSHGTSYYSTSTGRGSGGGRGATGRTAAPYSAFGDHSSSSGRQAVSGIRSTGPQASYQTSFQSTSPRFNSGYSTGMQQDQGGTPILKPTAQAFIPGASTSSQAAGTKSSFPFRVGNQ